MVFIMPIITIINNRREINLNESWVPSGKFNSKDRIVDQNGHKIAPGHQGPQYRIIEKRERAFSGLERFGRGLLGTAAVICSLSLSLFSKSVRNLFTKSKENIRFAVLETPVNLSNQAHLSSGDETVSDEVSTESINNEYKISQTQLETGISISKETISKIENCIRNVLQRKEGGGVKLYDSQQNHRVFALNTAPGLIFKMKATKNSHPVGKDDSMKARYERMINAKTIVRTHQLGLLVIPNAKLFTVNVEGDEYDIIAERKLDINPHESAQEQYFHDHAKSLNETIRQLAIFICKTGYSDVEWRNNPVLNNSLDKEGNRKIALIDVEEMNSPETGLFGGVFNRRGLVRCVTEEQGKIVEEVANQNGIKTGSFANAHALRKEEIEDANKLREYYKNNNIISGNEVVTLDENLVDFPEYPGQIEEIRRVTKDLIKAINDKISNASEEESIKGRRYVLINTNKAPFTKLDHELIDDSVSPNSYITAEDRYNATYMGYVVKKLVELGHIYKLVKRNGHGHFLQA